MIYPKYGLCHAVGLTLKETVTSRRMDAPHPARHGRCSNDLVAHKTFRFTDGSMPGIQQGSETSVGNSLLQLPRKTSDAPHMPHHKDWFPYKNALLWGCLSGNHVDQDADMIINTHPSHSDLSHAAPASIFQDSWHCGFLVVVEAQTLLDADALVLESRLSMPRS